MIGVFDLLFYKPFLQNEKPRLLEILNDKEVIICSSDRKLRVFDLGKMEITRSFQGKMFEHIPFTPYGYVELVVLKDRGGKNKGN